MTERDTIRAALHHIPAHDRDTWLRMGMAVKSELGDAGFNVWDAWSQQADTYNARDARDVWKSIRANGKITIGTLFHEAKGNGWCGEGTYQKPTAEEIAELDRKKWELEGEEERRRAEAREKAEGIWRTSSPARGNHYYLASKRIKSHGLRMDGKELIVPVRDGDGVLHSLQRIDEEGGKRFLPNGRVRGCYHMIGKPHRRNGTLCVCEGLATGASIHEVTGHAVAVAFNAGNLLAVAKAMRERFPDLRLILCADDDASTPGNPGLTKAREAALAVGGFLAVPDFGENRPEGVSDFNDMVKHRGKEVVKNVISNAKPPAMGEHGPDAENAPGGEAKPDIHVVIERLAKLGPLEYDQVRQAEADKLGVRVATLDAEVLRARSKLRQEKRAECSEAPSCPTLDGDIIYSVNLAFKAAGYGGDTRLPLLLYLCVTTRLLKFNKGKMLAHSQLVGGPSSGKNFAVDKVLGLLPEDACLRIDAGTPKALIYSDEELVHRIVFFAEADSLPISEGASGLADGDSRSAAASALRSLASDGYLSFDVVERGEDGKFVTRHIQKDGPTMLLTTTVKAIGGQMGTRLWEIPVREDDEQIKAALLAGITSDAAEKPSHDSLVSYQSFLQSKAPWNVAVPFDRELADGLLHKGMNPNSARLSANTVAYKGGCGAEAPSTRDGRRW